ncbi:MAG: histidine phosphatase family protein [Acidimicrobiales bacterium]|nr:histidine phosphatase family protein [Acidimicrobiales bacterium]
MELVLVRHAEPEWVREGLSVDNPPLTDRGRDQARRLADRLAHEHFDAVMVSTMQRACQTAAPLLEVLGAEPRFENWLEELRMPDWTGTPSEEVDELFTRARARPIEDHWDGMAGGESFRAFHERITKGLEASLAPLGTFPTDDDTPLWEIDDEDARVLVVAHAGTNATIIGHMLGIQPLPWEWERFVMFHASFSVLRPMRIGQGWSFNLFKLGDAEHLPDQMRTR